MSIKEKRKGPKPNVPSNWERWQVLALQPSRIQAATELLYQTNREGLTRVKCSKLVKEFHQTNTDNYSI